MTTTPARPTFTQDARGHYPCPYPACRQTFTRTQGVSRHWNQQHATQDSTAPHVEEQDDVETFSPEVEALHARLYGPPGHSLEDVAEEFGVDLDEDEQPRTLREALTTAPATADGVQLLTPEQAHDATGWPCRIDPDAILALSDATSGLVDAITRLVAVGYDRTEARAIVLDLIDKLADHPNAATAA